MTKFNIEHREDNQEPDIYDLRNDLEGINLELINLFSNFNAVLNNYFTRNHEYYSKPISKSDIDLLKIFKEKHVTSIEKSYEKQVEFIQWFSEFNGKEITQTTLEDQKW